MKPLDFLKAFGLGVLILALNLAMVFALGFGYELIDPGHPRAYYEAIYPKIGNWSAPATGITLLFLAAWRFGRRRPERNPHLFGLAIWASYFGIDVAMSLAMAPISALLVPPFLIGLVGGLAGSLGGAALANRRPA